MKKKEKTIFKSTIPWPGTFGSFWVDVDGELNYRLVSALYKWPHITLKKSVSTSNQTR